MLPSARKCATYTMTLWSASHCSNMVFVPVATCQDLAENGLPQLMPSPARLRSHVGSPNKVKVISKEPRWKVRRSKWLRFENISTETDVSDKTRNLHAEQLCITSKTLIYILFHMKGGHVCYSTFTIVYTFSLLWFTASSGFLSYSHFISKSCMLWISQWYHINNHEHLMSTVLDYLLFLSLGASNMPLSRIKPLKQNSELFKARLTTV